MLFYAKTLHLTYFTCGDLIHVVWLYKESNKMSMLEASAVKGSTGPPGIHIFPGIQKYDCKCCGNIVTGSRDYVGFLKEAASSHDVCLSSG